LIDPKILDEIARRIAEVLPAGLGNLPNEFRANLRSVVSSTLARADLVTREEFDVQSAVLARTRAKLEALESKVAALEAKQRTGQDDAQADG